MCEEVLGVGVGPREVRMAWALGDGRDDTPDAEMPGGPASRVLGAGRPGIGPRRPQGGVFPIPTPRVAPEREGIDSAGR